MKYPLILILLLGLGRLQAQEVMSSSGGDLSGNNGSISYSVGQVFFTSLSGSTGTVSEGVQQPYEIFVVTGINENPETEVVLDLFPNPSSGFAILRIKYHDYESLTYDLWNANGTLVLNNPLEQEETVLDLEKLPPSVYYLLILNNGSIIKTFKIIKK
jgi:hypothetical protein